MSTSLTDLLRERVKFDRKAANKASDGYDGDYYFSIMDWELSAKLENDRLQPILTALIKVVEACQELLSDTQHADHHCGDSICPVDKAREVLARLREVVSEPEKRGEG